MLGPDFSDTLSDYESHLPSKTLMSLSATTTSRLDFSLVLLPQTLNL